MPETLSRVFPRARHGPRGPMVRFAGAAIGFAVAFWAIYLVFVTTDAGQRLENAALRAAALRADTTRADSLGYLSQVSVASFVGAMAIIALVAMARRRPGLGVFAAIVMGVSVLAAEVLKEALPRPGLVDGPDWILRNSFPSGTATVAASVGIGALLVAPDRVRWLVLPAAAALAAIIGQSTQITGWHRASDALGGVVLAAGVASLGLVALARIGHVQASSLGHVHRRVYGLVWVVAVGTIVLGLVVLGLFAAFPLLRAPDDADSVFLHTASDLVVFGLSTAVITAFARVIEPFTLGTSAAPEDGSGSMEAPDPVVDPTGDPAVDPAVDATTETEAG